METIRVSDTPALKTDSEKELFWRMVLTAFWTLVLMAALQSFLPVQSRAYLLSGVAVLLGTLFCGLIALQKAGAAFGGTAFLTGAAGAALILGADGLLRGGAGYLNCLINWWNITHEDGKVLIEAGEISTGDLHLFLIVLALILGGAVWELLRRKKLALLLLLSGAEIFQLLLLDHFSPVLTAGLVTGGMGGWFYCFRRNAVWRQVCWTWGLGAVLLAGALWQGAEKFTSIQELRENIDASIYELRFGRDSLPRGDLDQAQMMLTGEEERLTVTTDQIKNLYLRGYVGDRYQTGQWKPLSKADFGGEQSGMLDWLAAADFYPQTQYTRYLEAGENESPGNRVTVRNQRAVREYVYMPYGAKAPQGTRSRLFQDQAFRTRQLAGSESYSFSEYGEDMPGELLWAENWVTDPRTEDQERYAQAEAVYRSFVYDHYLDVESNLAPLISRMFWSGEDVPEVESVYTATDRIRQVLREQTVYGSQPAPAPEGTDPIYWFLTGSGRGNSAYYASAAVEAYRANGIPARYVEGYLATAEQIRQAKGDQVVLTSQDSHAWAEVYLDGLGWIPVDVTPGYYYDALTLKNMVEHPSRIQHTASVEQNAEDSGDLLEGQAHAERADEPVGQPEIGMKVLEGMIAAVLLIAAVMLIVAECVRSLYRLYLKWRWNRAGLEERGQMLSRMILKILKSLGVESHLGWETQQTEVHLREKLPWLSEGAYCRVSQLMEKQLYGEQALEASEIRVLGSLIRQIYEDLGRLKLKERISLYFLCPL